MDQFLQISLRSRPEDERLTSTEKTQVQTCRLLCFLGASLVFLLSLVRLFSSLEAADPIWVGLGVAGLLGSLCAATYVSERLRRRCGVLTQAGSCVVMAWAVAVAILNHATGAYVLGLLLVYAGLVGSVGLCGRSAEPAWWFAALGLLLTTVGFVLAPPPQMHPLIVLAGMATAGVGTGLAVQAHLSIQEHLREQRGQWRHLMENLQEAVMITVEGDIAYANAQAATLFGASDTGELQGCSVFDLVTPEARENVQKQLDMIEEGQSTETHEHRAKGLGGEERVVQSQSVPVQYEGEDAALSVVRDVTHWRKAQDALSQRAELEHLIVEISAGFIDTPVGCLDQTIEEALGSVGSFVGADRSYVFLFDGDPEADPLDETTQSNTHEWCAEGIASQKENLQDILCAAIPWWTEQMCRKEPLTISSVSDLPEAAADVQELLEDQHIQSLAVLPMTQGERLVGFVGFDAVETRIDWDDETVTILRVLGDAIASALRRKEMEEKLREREERLRAITENVSEGIYRSTADEGLVFANRTFAEMFGYEGVEEVLEIDPATLYSTPEDRERLREAVRGQDSFDGIEVEFQRADGTTFIGLMSGSIVRDAAGEVQYYDGAITDITDRKTRERRLRVLSEAVEQAEDGVFITEVPDASETTPPILYANPAFEEMTGYEEEELLGQTARLLRGPDTDQEVLASLREAMQAEEPWSGETINYRKDGTPFVAQWNTVPVRDEEGRIEYWASIQRDVTERREIEERLREREARLRGLANSLPGVIYQFVAHPDGTHGTRFVSDRAESLLGISSDPDHFYEQFIECVPPSHRADVRESAREAVAQEERWRYEMPFEKPSGERIWLLGISTPQRRGEELIFNGVLLDITERKKAERAVQEERDRFETLFEGLPTPVLRYTADQDATLITDVNEAFENVFGVDRAEAEGEDIDELLMPEREAALSLNGQIRADETVQHEVRCEAADGPRDFRIQVAGRHSDTGPPEGQAIYTDITARKRREQALRRQNDLFAMAQDLASVGAIEYDVRTDELTWTDEVYRIHGVSKGFDPTLKSVIEYYHPEDRPRIRDLFERAVQEGEPFIAELRLFTQSGEQRWVRTRMDPQASDGQIVRVRGSIQDITERKRRERALKETNATLEAILENLPPGVLAEDASRSVLAANESFCTLLGLPCMATELTGRDAATVTRQTAGLFADPEAFASRTQEILDRGEPVFEEELALDDGRVLERDFVPYELEDGTAALWVYRDVTERKEREQRLREAKDEAQEANRMKSVFLANMSHEIRTPLTSIIGFAEAIGDEVGDRQEGSIPRFAGLIEESGRRLLETLDAVLNLSKLEAGEMGLSPEPISVAGEAEEMVELFGPRAEEEGIDLQVDLPSDTPCVRADPGGLRIVLRNLVSNALKYTKEGGCVWVRTRPAEKGAAVEVEDTGIGMDPEEASSLFGAFRQGSEGVAREYEGSGLGLAVTKRVVDEMEGTIEVETEKGEGSCFTVQLPPSRNGERGG
jgi:PAS domain S-box-containing protein